MFENNTNLARLYGIPLDQSHPYQIADRIVQAFFDHGWDRHITFPPHIDYPDITRSPASYCRTILEHAVPYTSDIRSQLEETMANSAVKTIFALTLQRKILVRVELEIVDSWKLGHSVANVQARYWYQPPKMDLRRGSPRDPERIRLSRMGAFPQHSISHIIDEVFNSFKNVWNQLDPHFGFLGIPESSFGRRSSGPGLSWDEVQHGIFAYSGDFSYGPQQMYWSTLLSSRFIADHLSASIDELQAAIPQSIATVEQLDINQNVLITFNDYDRALAPHITSRDERSIVFEEVKNESTLVYDVLQSLRQLHSDQA